MNCDSSLPPSLPLHYQQLISPSTTISQPSHLPSSHHMRSISVSNQPLFPSPLNQPSTTNNQFNFDKMVVGETDVNPPSSHHHNLTMSSLSGLSFFEHLYFYHLTINHLIIYFSRSHVQFKGGNCYAEIRLKRTIIYDDLSHNLPSHNLIYHIS